PGVCQVLGNVVIVLDHGYTCSTLSDVRLEHDWKCQSVSLPKGPDATQLLFVVETSAEACGARDKFGRVAETLQDVGLGFSDKAATGDGRIPRGEECQAAGLEREVRYVQGNRRIERPPRPELPAGDPPPPGEHQTTAAPGKERHHHLEQQESDQGGDEQPGPCPAPHRSQDHLRALSNCGG